MKKKDRQLVKEIDALGFAVKTIRYFDLYARRKVYMLLYVINVEIPILLPTNRLFYSLEEALLYAKQNKRN